MIHNPTIVIGTALPTFLRPLTYQIAFLSREARKTLTNRIITSPIEVTCWDREWNAIQQYLASKQASSS